MCLLQEYQVDSPVLNGNEVEFSIPSTVTPGVYTVMISAGAPKEGALDLTAASTLSVYALPRVTGIGTVPTRQQGDVSHTHSLYFFRNSRSWHCRKANRALPPSSLMRPTRLLLLDGNHPGTCYLGTLSVLFMGLLK